MRDTRRGAVTHFLNASVEFIPPLLTDFDVSVIIQAANELGSELGTLRTRHGKRSFDQVGEVESSGVHGMDSKGRWR